MSEALQAVYQLSNEDVELYDALLEQKRIEAAREDFYSYCQYMDEEFFSEGKAASGNNCFSFTACRAWYYNKA